MIQPKPSAPVAPRAKVPLQLGVIKGNAAKHVSRLARALAGQEDKQNQPQPVQNGN